MMKLKMKLLFLLSLTPFLINAQLSPKIDSLFNDETKMSVKSVVGNWKTRDSIPWETEIIELPHEVILSFNDSRSYSFHKDSLGRVGVRGFLMQWPPQYCHIRWMNGMELELSFYSLTRSDIYAKRNIFREPIAK